MRKWTVNDFCEVTQDGDPFIIAEVGNNHNGSVKLCKSLIKRAKDNGADAVKLQKRNPEKLFTKDMFDSPYVNNNSFGPTYGTHRSALEFTREQWEDLIDYAKTIGIPLFATPFDIDSADFLHDLDMPLYKLASGTLRDIPLVRHVAEFGKPIVASTGGGSWKDVDRLVLAIAEVGTPFTVLHCVASYPNRAEDMNLSIIPAMMERYPEIIIGLSDHYQNSLMANVAYCLGARVFEKHFTADHGMNGPDHSLSLEPQELQEMVHDLQRIRASFGKPDKVYMECEKKGIYKMGKGLYYSHRVTPGQILTPEDIVIKSPEAGIPPYELDYVVGMRVKGYRSKEQPIEWSDLYEKSL